MGQLKLRILTRQEVQQSFDAAFLVEPEQEKKTCPVLTRIGHRRDPDRWRDGHVHCTGCGAILPEG